MDNTEHTGAGMMGADAFTAPGAEVDWSCEHQAKWSKRVDVAFGGGSGVTRIKVRRGLEYQVGLPRKKPRQADS